MAVRTLAKPLKPKPVGAPMRVLRDHELIFIDAYLGERSADKRAAKAHVANCGRIAGYAAATAYREGARLLRHPAVIAEIARRTGPAMRRHEVTAERVIGGLAELAFTNVLDFGHVTPDGGFRIDLTKMDRCAAGGIASIKTRTYRQGKGEDATMVTETELKMADRRPALEALARYLKIIGGDAQDILQPIRLILMHAPPTKEYDAGPLNITNLAKDGPTK